MKKLLSIFTAVMLLCAITSCNTEADKTELSDVQAPEMTAEIMEQLIDDMLVGTCVPQKYKAMLGDECIKDWDELTLSSSEVKYGSGLGNPIVLYNDGSCRIGYNSALYSVCPLTQIDSYDHPEYLYDTLVLGVRFAAGDYNLYLKVDRATDLCPHCQGYIIHRW